MSTDRHDEAVAGFVRRVVAFHALREFLVLGSAWAFVWGTAVLVLRVATDLPRDWMLMGAAGFAIALAAAVWRGWRARPGAAAVRALCDDRSGAGGLLMASGETPLGAWAEHLPGPTLPDLRWRGGRTFAMFAAAGGFVVVAFLAPTRFAQADVALGLDISGDAERLEAQVEVLEEEEILEPREAEAMQQRLAQLQDDAAGRDPARTWESLDHMSDRVERTAQDAAQEGIAHAESLTQVQALAEALAQEQEALEPEQLAQAMAGLADMAQEAMKEDAAANMKLDEAMREALRSGALSKAQLSKLASAMRGRKMELEQTMARLVDAKLVEKRMLSRYRSADEAKSEGLAEYLAGALSDADVQSAMKQWGRGGISRGRGDAEMTWKTQASSDHGARFEEQALPPAALEAMKDSRMIGLSAGAPTLDTDAAAASSGALRSAEAGGGSAVSQVILPRYRDAVERYFERKD